MSRDYRADALAAIRERIAAALDATPTGLVVEDGPEGDLVVSWPLDPDHPQPEGVPNRIVIDVHDADDLPVDRQITVGDAVTIAEWPVAWTVEETTADCYAILTRPDGSGTARREVPLAHLRATS